MDVAVVGGGITGLAAAHQLVRAGAEVVVFEASDRLGGKILTTPVAGRPVDAGADAFLARHPAGVELCREIGLDHRLVAPAQRRARVLVDGELHPLPDHTVLGVPTDLAAVARSGILSRAGYARLAADLAGTALPLPDGADAPVGRVVRERLGDEALERLVGPLIGGINAGDPDRLSITACTPQLATAAAHPSLIEGARALRAEAAASTDPEEPVFFGFPGGMEELVAGLAGRLRLAGVDIRLGAPVTAIEPAGTGWTVATTGGPVTVDAAVITVPAFEAAALLAGVSPAAVETLASVDYASVALVTMAIAPEEIQRPLDASGFLVASVEGLLMTACSWTSAKWAHLAAGAGAGAPVIVRVSAGRAGDPRALDLDDAALVSELLDELAPVIGLAGEPLEVRVTRWPRSFPQYAVGHLDRVAALEAAVAADAPGVVVAGAGLRGLGIPACIDQGRRAATTAVTALAARAS